jgi:hypothetical protein
VLRTAIVPHLVAVPDAGSCAIAPVLNAVTTRWAGAPCAVPLGPSGHFGRWAKSTARGRGPNASPLLVFLFPFRFKFFL